MIQKQKTGKSRLKVPQFLNLGAVLPTQYAQSILPLESQQVLFINLQLSKTAVQNGFFLVKEQQNQFHVQVKFALKPGKQVNICVAAYAKQLKSSSNFSGQLYLHQQSIMHTIQLAYRIQIPKILSKKMLISAENQKIYRIMINKAITNEARIMLQNQQKYQLGLEVGILYPINLQNKENPFLLKIKTPTCIAKPKQAFIIFVSIQTNIGYKKEFKGIKKCVFRNVLTLKTGSQLFYAMPLQIIVVFVKQPQIKSE